MYPDMGGEVSGKPGLLGWRRGWQEAAAGGQVLVLSLWVRSSACGSPAPVGVQQPAPLVWRGCSHGWEQALGAG